MRFKNVILLLSVFFIWLTFSACTASSLKSNESPASAYPSQSMVESATPSPTLTPTPTLDPYDQMIEDERAALVPYWDYDLSDYTPIFVNNNLIAIVNGDDWISCYDLYPYLHWMDWNEDLTASANTEYLENKDSLYIYNVDGLVNALPNFTYNLYYFDAMGDIWLVLDYEQYLAANPKPERFCAVSSNANVALPSSIDVTKDTTVAKYVLDIDGDGKKETVLRQQMVKDLQYISRFQITRGEEILFNWEHVEEIEAEALSAYDDLGYDVLNGPNSEFKAIFMDFNNDGFFEILTEEASYGFHNYSYSLYTYTKGAWQDVAGLYSGD